MFCRSRNNLIWLSCNILLIMALLGLYFHCAWLTFSWQLQKIEHQRSKPLNHVVLSRASNFNLWNKRLIFNTSWGLNRYRQDTFLSLCFGQSSQWHQWHMKVRNIVHVSHLISSYKNRYSRPISFTKLIIFMLFISYMSCLI